MPIDQLVLAAVGMLAAAIDPNIGVTVNDFILVASVAAGFVGFFKFLDARIAKRIDPIGRTANAIEHDLEPLKVAVEVLAHDVELIKRLILNDHKE